MHLLLFAVLFGVFEFPDAGCELVVVKCCERGKRLHRYRNECVPVHPDGSEIASKEVQAAVSTFSGAATNNGTRSYGESSVVSEEQLTNRASVEQDNATGSVFRGVVSQNETDFYFSISGGYELTNNETSELESDTTDSSLIVVGNKNGAVGDTESGVVNNRADVAEEANSMDATLGNVVPENETDLDVEDYRSANNYDINVNITDLSEETSMGVAVKNETSNNSISDVDVNRTNAVRKSDDRDSSSTGARTKRKVVGENYDGSEVQIDNNNNNTDMVQTEITESTINGVTDNGFDGLINFDSMNNNDDSDSSTRDIANQTNRTESNGDRTKYKTVAAGNNDDGNKADVSATRRPFLSDLSWLPEVMKDRVTNGSEIVFGSQNSCSDPFTVRLELSRDGHRMKWLENGSLILQSYTVSGNYDERIFGSQDFCFDSFTEDDNSTQHAVLLCLCNRVKCVRKCCPLGQSYVKTFNVAKGSSKFQCGSYKGVWTPFDLEVREKNISYETVPGEVRCQEGEQGNIQLLYRGIPEHIIQSTWIDTTKDNSVCEDSVVFPDTNTEVKGVVKCFPKNPFAKAFSYTRWMHIPEVILWLMVIITTQMVPRKRVSVHSQVHDYALVWHAACLMFRTVMYLIKNIWDRYCIFSSVVIYFFATSASLWLSVLSINMACGFWKPLGAHTVFRKRNNPMVLWYSLFAWGVSGAMTVFTATMWYCRHVPAGLLRPTLHDTGTCYLETDPSQKMATFAYFYGPMGFLLLINVGLFLSITARVHQMRRNTSILRRQKEAESKEGRKSQSSFGNDRGAIMYIKLLLLLGVLEMGVEIVTWILNTNPGYFGFTALWIDVIRAASMFGLCCCNKKAILGIRERINSLISVSQKWRPQEKKKANVQEVQGQYSVSKE